MQSGLGGNGVTKRQNKKTLPSDEATKERRFSTAATSGKNFGALETPKAFASGPPLLDGFRGA